MIRLLITLAVVVLTPWANLPAQDLVAGGDFPKQDIRPWKVFSLKDTPATEFTVADGVITIKALGATDNAGARQMVQELHLVNEKKYKLSFDAKARFVKAGTFAVAMTPKPPKVGNMGLWRNFELTEAWQTFNFHFVASPIGPGEPTMLKFMMGTAVGEISYRNIKLVAVEEAKQ